MIGFIRSRRELENWGWVHCSGFDENDEGWVDLLVTKVRGRYVAIGFIKLRKLYNIGGILGREFKGYLGLNGIDWSFKLGAHSISIRVSSDPNNMIIAKYDDPEEPRYCHNTEIGNLDLTINKEKFSCLGRVFFEYGITQSLPVPTWVTVVNDTYDSRHHAY